MEKDKNSSVFIFVMGDNNTININEKNKKKRKPFFQKLKALGKLVSSWFVNVVVLLIKTFTNIGFEPH